MVDFYLRYAETLFEHFRGRVTYWLTFNEINVMSTMPWNAGGISSADEAVKMTAAYHQFIASALAVKAGRAIDPKNKIGMMYAGHFSYPNSCHPDDIQGNEDFAHKMMFYPDVQCRGYYPNYKLKELERQNITLPVLPGDAEIQGRHSRLRFFSFHYMTHVCGKNTTGILRGLNGLETGYKILHIERSAWGWGIDPERLALRLELPVRPLPAAAYDRRNGLGAADTIVDGKVHDYYRIDYLHQHISEGRRKLSIWMGCQS